MPPDLSRLFWAALLALPLLAAAQEEEPPLYTVEVIVFTTGAGLDPAYRYPGEPDTREALDLIVPESPPPLPPLRREGTLDPIGADDASAGRVFGDAASGYESEVPLATEAVPRVLPIDPDSPPSPVLFVEDPVAVRRLDDEERTLVEAWNRLLRHPNYRPLVHLAWRQPAAPFGDPQPIRIHGGERTIEPVTAFPLFPGDQESTDAPVEIDGTVALERGRFLHLRVDLARRVETGNTAAARIPLPLLRPGDPIGPSEDAFIHRLQERRQITRDSVNYFDHRHFGMIAVVRQWASPDDTKTP